MYRVTVFGVAFFCAILGIAVIGGQQQALAGHGCHGCRGVVACDGDNVGCASVTCCGEKGTLFRSYAGRTSHAVRRSNQVRTAALGARVVLAVARSGAPTTAAVKSLSRIAAAPVTETAPTEAAPETAPAEEPAAEAPANEAPAAGQ